MPDQIETVERDRIVLSEHTPDGVPLHLDLKEMRRRELEEIQAQEAATLDRIYPKSKKRKQGVCPVCNRQVVVRSKDGKVGGHSVKGPDNIFVRCKGYEQDPLPARVYHR